jgi:hypothetical protein
MRKQIHRYKPNECWYRGQDKMSKLRETGTGLSAYTMK